MLLKWLSERHRKQSSFIPCAEIINELANTIQSPLAPDSVIAVSWDWLIIHPVATEEGKGRWTYRPDKSCHYTSVAISHHLHNMSGTILITGANGSLALEFINSLLSQYPSYTVIGTVRSKNAESDPPSALKALKSQFPESNLILYTLDLSSLGAVRVFTAKMKDMIASGTYPRLAAVICNAFSWSLSGGQKYSKDKYENTFQVSHLSHHLLVLSLLKSMDTTRGRIVMLGSSTHDPDNADPFAEG